MSNTPEIHCCFEPKSSTWQYVVADPETRAAIIIDPVLDFDVATSTISTSSADSLVALVDKHQYTVQMLLETHAHADHLTASKYLQQHFLQRGQPQAKICIGKRILQVQETFAKRYGIDASELNMVFDKLFDDNEEFSLGNLSGKVLYLPGHTPDHLGYQIGENVFTGDSIFNPDVGSARCDFPGGSAHQLYRSMRDLLSLPPHYRLYTGHDYPSGDRKEPQAFSTVAEQNEGNKHVKAGVPEEQFVKWRAERDATLSEPRLIHHALQFNIRAGRLPQASPHGYRFLHIPLKVPGTIW
jgi:glyoxylase-like metal-dependent hydrolase (beta-lactamase superfamily II)